MVWELSWLEGLKGKIDFKMGRRTDGGQENSGKLVLTREKRQVEGRVEGRVEGKKRGWYEQTSSKQTKCQCDREERGR